MKQKLIELKREINNSTSLIKDFKTPRLAINRPKASRRKEIIKSKNQWNWKQENNGEKLINKKLGFEEINKILAKSMITSEKTKITNTQDIATDPADVQRVKSSYEQLYSHEFDNLHEIYQFLENHSYENSSKLKYLTWIALELLKKFTS